MYTLITLASIILYILIERRRRVRRLVGVIFETFRQERLQFDQQQRVKVVQAF